MEVRCETALARLEGRGGAAMVVLVGETGRLVRDCLLGFVRGIDGVLGASSVCESCPLRTLPAGFRRLRIVTDAGTWLPSALPLRGDPLGGVSTGAGSFDLAFCTLSSKLCIFPRRLRSCMIEEDLGRPEGAPVGRTGRLALVRLCLYVEVACVLLIAGTEGPRVWPFARADIGIGRGVALGPFIDNLDLGTGVVNGCGNTDFSE